VRRLEPEGRGKPRATRRAAVRPFGRSPAARSTPSVFEAFLGVSSLAWKKRKTRTFETPRPLSWTSLSRPRARGMRARLARAAAVFALACAAPRAAADPLAAFKPPRRNPDASLATPRVDESLAPSPSSLAFAAPSASSTTSREARAQELDDASSTPLDTLESFAAGSPSLDSDVYAAVAFARSSSAAFENDERYAEVVRDAVDALESRLLNTSRDVLNPERAARDATLRVALLDLRDEIDRALPSPGGPLERSRLPVETYYGLRRPGRPLGGLGDALYDLDGPRRRAGTLTSSRNDRSSFDGDYDDLDAREGNSIDRVAYADVGLIGGYMQSLTYVFSSKRYDSPSAIDDWLRCSTLARPCTIAETLRRCTYEPKTTWYRERKSRLNAPLNWPYCADDLGEVYEFCTKAERETGVCDPRVARSRAVFERARQLEYERQRVYRARYGNLY